MARLYREAPLMSIWEGSGNVISLDVLRAIERTPESLSLLLEELEGARGLDSRLDSCLDDLARELNDRADLESRARIITEKMAIAIEGALMVRYANADLAEAFCASRLARNGGWAYGALPSGVNLERIVERVTSRLPARDIES
jgi:putative acyl-CoA dehydrogenase